mmetsp:Transcript_10684/g.16850  ORF Transcript_10684/g.16850 Transcript_10684/m.16850 type:complete len:110 (+) Transcript_10684:1259-1588(+)
MWIQLYTRPGLARSGRAITRNECTFKLLETYNMSAMCFVQYVLYYNILNTPTLCLSLYKISAFNTTIKPTSLPSTSSSPSKHLTLNAPSLLAFPPLDTLEHNSSTPPLT